MLRRIFGVPARLPALMRCSCNFAGAAISSHPAGRTITGFGICQRKRHPGAGLIPAVRAELQSIWPGFVGFNNDRHCEEVSRAASREINDRNLLVVHDLEDEFRCADQHSTVLAKFALCRATVRLLIWKSTVRGHDLRGREDLLGLRAHLAACLTPLRGWNRLKR